MKALARIWMRLFGPLDVLVFDKEGELIHGGEDDTVWCWHSRGVLHCYSLWYGGKHHPVWELHRTHIPLTGIGYWTKERTP